MNQRQERPTSGQERPASGRERDRERREQERGSVTLWLVGAALIAMVLVGACVDLNGRLGALQRVRDAAAQAARAGGQSVMASQTMDGTGYDADPSLAIGAAQSYLTAAGVPGSVTVTDGGTTLLVTTEDTYQPVFLGVLGIGPMNVSGTGQARLVRVVEGSER